jgi:hypothetical protein
MQESDVGFTPIVFDFVLSLDGLSLLILPGLLSKE